MFALILLLCTVAFYWGRMRGLLLADFAPCDEPRNLRGEVFK